MTHRTGGRRWLLAALAVTVVIGAVWGVQGGSCVTGSGGGADCASTPAVGVAGAWVLTIGGVLFVLHALRRGFRTRTREPRR
ncbi:MULTISPECIES: hypothetical protein [unclassified Actinotalea]|uniref:hypothetical protein n=1 Tax=unclassified Actinotalea TaxID=2638618 RepID=UPI0015F4D260|nr:MULTISPECIES: hypothetical protein [unclassified Actinotalea]